MWGFPHSSADKEPACNAEDPGSISGQEDLLEKDQATLPEIWETWVGSLGWEDPLEEGMATHSSILNWRIPWTEESGRLQSMGLQRVGHD